MIVIDRALLISTKRALEEAGIRPERRKGQNYVVDQGLIRCMMESACISADETVLEIGPGVGTLTAEIAKRAKRVIAVEKDSASAAYLRRRFYGGNVEVIEGDFLSMDAPKVDKVVSNLPYSISTPLTFKLISDNGFRFAVLTYQKEVADRLLARPGGPDYSRLSVATALLAEVKAMAEFPPQSFYPEPKVSSTVVVMRRRAHPDGIDWPSLDATLKLLFSQRRRTLRKALETLSKSAKVERDALESRFGTELLGRRVFELSPLEFVKISMALKGVLHANGPHKGD